jgi:hypothetical protein
MAGAEEVSGRAEDPAAVAELARSSDELLLTGATASTVPRTVRLPAALSIEHPMTGAGSLLQEGGRA